MSELKNSDKPEVYALRQDGGDWQISRRDFLKAAGIGAAALGAGVNGRFVRPVHAGEDMAALCSNAPAHKYEIVDLLSSADGKYLITLDKYNVIKCWDFETFRLIGTYEKMNGSSRQLFAGYYDGESCLFYFQGAYSENMIRYLVLPEMEKRNTIFGLKFGDSETINDIAVSRDETVYAAADSQKISFLRKTKQGEVYKLPKTLSVSENGKKYVLFNGENYFAVRFSENDFGTLDLSDGTIRKFDVPKIRDFAILPGDAAAILIDDSGDFAYRLVSMMDGKTVWKKTAAELGTQDAELCAVSVSPDGSMAIFAGTDRIWLVSTENGSMIRSFEIAFDISSNVGKIAVSGDGSKMAVAVDKSIFFISLPDLNVIGCPVDLDGMTTDTKAVEISGKDPVTGQPVNYTLPCGAPIPAGAVCTCNCVAGKNTPYGSGGGHYWHPN